MQQPGTFIEGKYEILGKIREGGMGAIYKVRHRLLDEIRVVKVMRPQVLSDDELRQRFAEEAKIATRLKHPNICTVHDFALDQDGTAYLVMEFIDGVTLAEMQQKPTPLGMTLDIVHQALLALAYLHKRNVVHRDIAPDNLMLTSDDDGMPLVKLIDLGISKALDRQGVDRTSTGVFLGKLKYASPEQYGALPPGEKIDGRSDLYCLGVVLYELLTGKRPFVGESPAELLRAHLFSPPLPFSETDPDGRVPPELQAVILKALEKKREDRFASAEDFDREILNVKSAIDSAVEAATTVAFFTKARSTRDSDSGITPSAQNRLDRQFGAHTTPSPSKPSLVSSPKAIGNQATAITPAPDSLAAAETRETAPLPKPVQPSRTARRAVPAALVIGAAVLGAFLLLKGRGRQTETPPVAVRSDSVTGPTEAPAAPVPTAVPTPEPAAAAASPEAAELPIAAVPTSLPPQPKATAIRPRPTAVRPAQVVARAIEPPERQNPVSQATAVPAAPPRAPTSAPPIIRPPAAVPAAAPPPEPEPKSAGASDADRIRDVIARYERAQNTLDADLYARVYPKVDRARIQSAFDEFRSQTVTLDQMRIEVAPGGTRATVRLHERRVAVPRIGSEQRLEANRTIALQKERDTWVITALQ
ncbi:MAG: protein kinase [Acidobacteriota bacterium]